MQLRDATDDFGTNVGGFGNFMEKQDSIEFVDFRFGENCLFDRGFRGLSWNGMRGER